MSLDLDERELARRTALAVLAPDDPERAAELDRDLDELLERVTARLPSAEQIGDPGHRIGPEFWVGTAAASAVWGAALLARAAFGSEPGRSRESNLARAKRRLAAKAPDPELMELLGDSIDKLLAVRERFAVAQLPGAPAPAAEPPADLRLRIDREDDRFAFRLESRDPSAGLPSGPLHSPRIARDPAAFAAGLLAEIERFGDRTPEERLVARRRLEAIALDFGERVLPRELAGALAGIRGRTLELWRDEPDLPWELLGMRGEDGAVVVLAEAFDLARRLGGRPTARELDPRPCAWVAPRSAGLPHAAEEREAVARRLGADRLVDVEPSYLGVSNALLDSRFGGWHFVAHGSPKGADPDHRGLVLDAYERWTGRDVRLASGCLARSRPLIFLNACGSARAGASLTGTAGIAPAFVEAGAGAVVAAAWSVRDSAAAAFAEGFYRALLDGQSIAAAVRAGRAEIDSRWAGHPAALAYVLYARPEARIR